MHRLNIALMLVVVAWGLLATPVGARADEDNATNGDVAAVRDAGKKYLEAKRQGDFEALRALWTADADYIDATGQRFKVQDLIRDQEKLTATAPETDEADEADAAESSLRFITDDVAIEDGTREYGVGQDGAVVSGRYTAVWVKRDGRWLLDSLREAVAKSPSAENHLQQLAWLLGAWVGTTDGAEMLVSSYLSDGGKFIVREFIVRADGRETLSGTQRIGWDPVARQIKSWTFDSKGGTGEGHWRRDGDRWVVESKDVMPNGETSATSVVYVLEGDGRFAWEVTRADVSGEKLPPLRVEFQRAAETEQNESSVE